jgi:4-hydroxy-3-polyprenylbenzoate decarboxylase
MSYDGLGAFALSLEARGELVRISRTVDPVLEVAAIADRAMKAGGPALLFENVKGSSFPLLINAFGSRARMAHALGVADIEEHARRIGALLEAHPPGDLLSAARLAGRLGSLAHVPPRRVAEGPCQAHVLLGKDVDLDRLPVLTSWPKDGGPFFTLPNVITKDPDTGARNIGMYRMQRIDRRTTAMHWQVHKTGARHFRRAKELGRRLEVAVAFGGDPALTYAATAPLPDGIDEWMFAGFLRKSAVKTVRCKTIELEVPADADFVLEGYVDPEEPPFEEGPFGDHTGYYTPKSPFPVFHVTALTHRNDAVYPATIVGPPPMEDAWFGKATERLFLPLLRTMFPEIVDMNLPVEGAFHNLVLVSIKKQYPRHAARIAHGLWGAGQMSFSKVICVVDDDVDVQNTAEVAWRLLANLDPKRDLSFVEGPIDQLDHGADQALYGGKVSIDGTRKWPEEGYAREWPEVACTTPAVAAQASAVWAEICGRRGPPQAAPSPRPVAALAERTDHEVDHARGVRSMFDRIAPTYDLLNRAISVGLDRRWRARAVGLLRGAPHGARLDLCAGTMDLTKLLAERAPDERVVALDFSEKMLARGRSKASRAEVVVGDAMCLPFEDAEFAAVVCGFGIRNVADPARAVAEVRRVLRPGGVFVTLDSFRPATGLPRLLHGAYTKSVFPALGFAFARDRAAYSYFVESVAGFVTRPRYEAILRDAGFSRVSGEDLVLGALSLVRAEVAS